MATILLLFLLLDATRTPCLCGHGGREGLQTPVCWLYFTAELREGRGGPMELYVAIISQRDNIICRDPQILSRDIDLTRSGFRPLVQIYTCPSEGTIVQALFTTLELMQTSANTSAGDLGQDLGLTDWFTELPPYLNTGCVEVIIKEFRVGSGAVLPELRVRFGSEAQHTIIPEERIPSCIQTGAGYTKEYASWVRVERNASCEGGGGGEGRARFVSDQVHFVSNEEIFVTGNALLYSPNKGGIFYQLLLPTPIIRIDQFVTSSDFKTYAALITSVNVGTELWLGFAGNPGVIRLYPSTSLKPLQILEENDLAAMLRSGDVTLILTSQNELLLLYANMEYRIPTPVLLSFYLFSLRNATTNCPSELLDRHPLDLFTSGFSPLSLCFSSQCPFVSVALEASICRNFSRTAIHLPEEEDQLREQQFGLLPEKNCSVLAGDLPRNIYMGKLDSYRISVTFQLLGLGEDSDNLQYVLWFSDPTHFNITVEEGFSDDGSSYSYQASFTEQGMVSGQFLSGHDHSHSIVDLQIPGIALQCVDPLSRFVRIPGNYWTRVHIGCPPGLSLVFDANVTTARGRYSQYCTPRDNISCYLFSNVFYPSFLINDEVTGAVTPYTGQYTLRLLAGGETADSMSSFAQNTDVEKGIWHPVGTFAEGVHQPGSGMRWVCASTSVCGELLPRDGHLPQYYFLIEASNSGVVDNQTYCNFSVQFLIELHGMPMGPITNFIVLLLWLVVLFGLIFIMFAAWKIRKWPRVQWMLNPSKRWFVSIRHHERRKDWLEREVKSRRWPTPSVHVQSEADNTPYALL